MRVSSSHRSLVILFTKFNVVNYLCEKQKNYYTHVYLFNKAIPL